MNKRTRPYGTGMASSSGRRAPSAMAGVGLGALGTAFLSLWGFALVLPSPGVAQESTVVSGVVRDEFDSPLSLASVVLRSEETATLRRQRTGHDGSFSFADVAPGDYTLVVSRRNYRETSRPIAVSAGRPIAVDAVLERIHLLERISVTSTRGEQAIGNVAGAVTQIDKDEIQNGQKALSLEEPLRRVPGVRVESELGTASRTRIIVRGTGTRANSPAGSGVRGVKVLVDGIPKNNAGGSAQDLINVDLESIGRVEVLRGPSSALYGNQSGGVVNLITEEPPADPFFEYRQLIGSYGLFREHAKVGGRTQQFSYLLSVYRTDQDGWREHSRFHTTGLHSKLGFLVDDRTTLTLVAGFDRAFEESPGPLTLEQFDEDPQQASPVFLDNDVQATLDELRFGLTLNRREVFGAHDQFEATIFDVPRHLGPFKQIGIRIPQDFHNRGANLRYTNASSLGSLGNRFTLGADFQNTPITTGVFVTSTGAAAAALEENATTFGVYALDEVDLSDEVQLSAGIRYDKIRFSSRNLITEGAPKVSRSFDRFTPKFGLTYSPSPLVSVYGAFSQGFETPIIGELRVVPGGEFGFNQGLDPQRSTNFEVGGRGEPLDWLSFEAAVFRQVVDDLISPVGTFPQNSFENVGQVDQVGIELATHLRSRTGFGLDLAYTFSDFTIEEFMTGDTDFSGNKLPGVPDHTFFGELDYRHASGLEGAINVQHVSSFFHNNANDSSNEAYTVVNVRGRYAFESGNVGLAPFVGVNNVTDETYSAFALINDSSRRFYNPLPGVNVYGGMAVTF